MFPRYWPYADPMGAIAICLYIIMSWFSTGWGLYYITIYSVYTVYIVCVYNIVNLRLQLIVF